MLGMWFLACRSESDLDVRPAMTAILETQKRLEGWARAGRADSLAAAYTEDAWLMLPDLPPVVGRDSIRSFYANASERGRWKLNLSGLYMDPSGRPRPIKHWHNEWQVRDSIAIERTPFVLDFVSRPNSPTRSFARHGHHLIVWRLEADGQWRIQWNAVVASHLPGAPAPEIPKPPTHRSDLPSKLTFFPAKRD